MERVEGTENSGYIVLYNELCGLWSELKFQRSGFILVYRVNFVSYAAS